MFDLRGARLTPQAGHLAVPGSCGRSADTPEAAPARAHRAHHSPAQALLHTAAVTQGEGRPGFVPTKVSDKTFDSTGRRISLVVCQIMAFSDLEMGY